MRRAIVLACGAKKRTLPSPAIDLYIGNYYSAMKRVALMLAQPCDIFILSAKYGLIEGLKIVQPYEQKLNQEGAITKTEVEKQKILLSGYDEIIVLGGAAYHKLLGMGKRILNGGMFTQIKQARNFKI